MQRFHDVKLQLVRPGPPHNQLLSPLTSYLALCGGSSPVTFHIDIEHRQLLNRLEHLRYVVGTGPTGGAVPDRLRQGAVEGIGEAMGNVFARITSLNAELTNVRCLDGGAQGSEFVHLRLVLSGSELSLLPFELAISPQSYPGEGLRFCLQGSLPVVMTREIQRSRPMPVNWDCKSPPKILFIFAEPANLKVPKLRHLAAIQSALKPWIKISVDGDGASAETKKHLRVLSNASIEEIHATCAAEQFTHVHILAHGAAYERAGEQRYGVALCQQGAPETLQVVDGNRLAKALRAEGADGISRSGPLMVTLATCDSGQPGSVLIPGGGIAYDLHAEGIPWVIASQFPLTIPGSIRMTERLYPRILRGDDPRQVIYELRRYLYLSATNDHDWASMVAYTSMQDRFEERVANFFVAQTKRAIEVQMDLADELVKNGSPEDERIEQALGKARELIAAWESRLPAQGGGTTRGQRAECFGMKGSIYKRIGILQGRRIADATAREKEVRKELEKAAAAYQQAIDEWAADGNNFHWTATQRLALAAILGETPDLVIFQMAAKLAERDLTQTDRRERAWAHGTLAELALIRPWHEGGMDGDFRSVKREVVRHCREIVKLAGASFPVESTQRQFQRYADRWYLAAEEDESGVFLGSKIVSIAKAAVKELRVQ